MFDAMAGAQFRVTVQRPMTPLLLCWLVAMLLVMLTPVALLFDVALWRVLVVEVVEIAMLAFISWLKR